MDMTKCGAINLGLALCVACLVASAPRVAAAGLYKWTDDKGIVHYSDQLPPEAVNKGTVVMDKQGRAVKKIDPAPSPEELKAKETETENLKATARVKEEKTRKDIALLQSYTSEQEIDLARMRAISTIDGQLKSAETYVADLSRRRQELEKRKAALAGQPIPNTLENELSTVSEEIARQNRVITQRKDEVAAINARYDSDKRRWQEIRSDQARAAAAGLDITPPGGKTAAPKAPAAASSK
jgi:Domain of unknown function (DUF4124)